MTKSTLVIYVHPSPYKSKVNSRMFRAATSLDFVTGRDLYECYPNFFVDVAAEQQLLRQHEVIVFQFPLYWYSAPALLKEWMDCVLRSGFSHGDGGGALADKDFMISVTSGGSVAAYDAGERHGAPLVSYLAPLEQTARFCGMTVHAPFVVQGASDLELEEVTVLEKQFQNRLTEIGA